MSRKVVELFAGIGGFRVGLNAVKVVEEEDGPAAYEDGDFEFVWADQWEPSAKKQWAYDCYKKWFGDCVNEDIAKVDKSTIPDHDLLVGGFPCQDYSVAHSKATEKGIEGKKGVLWWQIYDTLEAKRPKFVLLENVDRLLKSPSKQRGRDFGIILRCLHDLGYDAEWRVVNSANYQCWQRRKRLFIFAFRRDTVCAKGYTDEVRWIIGYDGFFGRCFNVSDVDRPEYTNISPGERYGVRGYRTLADLSKDYSFTFENAGYMHDGDVWTAKVVPVDHGAERLRTILEKDADEKYYLTDEQIGKFAYLRGAKSETRRSKDGNHTYKYVEGAMSESDNIDKPARTLLTSEGTVNRSTHIIRDPQTNRLRFLTPTECERIQEFPTGWTEGMPDRKRYFVLGNAVITGIIWLMKDELTILLDDEVKE